MRCDRISDVVSAASRCWPRRLYLDPPRLGLHREMVHRGENLWQLVYTNQLHPHAQ